MIGRWRGTLLGLLAASVSLAGCAQYRGADTAGIADEVRKDALALVADYNSGNAAAAAAQDAPDYVGIFHGTANTVGPTADLAGMKAQMAAAKVRWEIGAGKVTVAKAGDIALFEAPYTFTATDPNGATSRDSGTWIAIFRRQDDGRMKLWRSIGSDGPPAK